MLEKLVNSSFLSSLEAHLLEQRSIVFEGLWDAPKALILAKLKQLLNIPILVISGGDRETKLYDDLQFFNCPCLEMPAWEALPGEAISPSKDIIGRRLEVLQQMAKASNCTALMPLQAALQKVPTKDALLHKFKMFATSEEYPFEELAKKLSDLGYVREKLVSDKGQFAVRGGIIDIFPVSSPHPFRMEFFGDEIEQIRIFDPQSQKSVEKVESFSLCPASEEHLLNEDCTNIFSYFDKPPIVVFDDLLALEDRLFSLSQMPGYRSNYVENFETFFSESRNNLHLYFANESVEALSQTAKGIKLGREYYTGKSPLEPITFDIFNHTISTHRMHTPFVKIMDFFEIHASSVELQKQDLVKAIAKHSDSAINVLFLSDSKKEIETMQSLFAIRPKNARFDKGYLSSGLMDVSTQTMILPYPELSHRYKISRKKWRSSYHTPVSEFHELVPGDLVVHFHNGIGKFIGIEKQKNHLGILSEFLIIEYADSAKLFVPISQAHLVSKYIGSHEERPQLHTIGASKWAKAKLNAQKSIIGYAKELLQMHAMRETKGGHIYPQDSDDTKAFEESFPFVETDDQLMAVSDIKKDMYNEKAIDRLVCGDVGYGKTEVAMRAAFKVVVDGGKQVAILVPTTVLAMQHFESFKERMEGFGVNVGIVSRFQKPKEIKHTLQNLAAGTIDILIGTHRLISKDVAFKDLGLIIIDEEQRFGVRAKEKLKKFKIGVDCITMSATPIPRTLYMSLIHAKEMSVINSPPQDRLPIKTIICERDNEVMQNALLRELARDGQAYFIHNRVETIFGVAEDISKLVPQAKVAVVHGQMDSDEIDEIFHSFKSGVTDILVATSIVENGIDIPNANTILIDRAHQFGVADLYQLRGRVGRWNKTAYAYFLTPKNQQLPEVSQKRLSALVEASGYGGGMKLAMRDLELRGAGDILGVKQSGHVSTVGFHLYCKLLKKAIDAIKQKRPTSFLETKMEFTFDAKLPDSYIDDDSIRLEIYHRLGECTNEEEVDKIFEELKDRFGPPPEPALWLYHMTRLRVFATHHQILTLKFDKFSIHVEKQLKKTTLKKSFLIPPLPSPREVELVAKKRIEEGFS